MWKIQITNNTPTHPELKTNLQGRWYLKFTLIFTQETFPRRMKNIPFMQVLKRWQNYVFSPIFQASLSVRFPKQKRTDRGAIKKNCFFLTFPERARPPSPPINLDAQNCSVKEILDSTRPPPLLSEKHQKNPVFLLLPLRRLCSRRSQIFWKKWI